MPCGRADRSSVGNPGEAFPTRVPGEKARMQWMEFSSSGPSFSGAPGANPGTGAGRLGESRGISGAIG